MFPNKFAGYDASYLPGTYQYKIKWKWSKSKIGYHGERLVKFQRDAAKNFENKLKPKLEKIEELGVKLDKGKQIDPGIKMIEELPYAIENEDNIEEPSE